MGSIPVHFIFFVKSIYVCIILFLASLSRILSFLLLNLKCKFVHTLPNFKWQYLYCSPRGKDWKCNCFLSLVRVYLGCLVCPLSCPLSTRKGNIKQKDDSMWKEIMKLMLKPTFILILMGTFLINMAYFVPLFYIPDMAVFMGVERTKANFLLSIFGKFNC